VPARDEWVVVQLMSHTTEIEYFGMEKAFLITKESDPNITRSDVENAGAQPQSPTVPATHWRSIYEA